MPPGGLAEAADAEVWDYALRQAWTIVTLDSDFPDFSILRGQPPKVIWLRCGNAAVAEVEALLCRSQSQIGSFAADAEAAYLEIWP